MKKYLLLSSLMGIFVATVPAPSLIPAIGQAISQNGGSIQGTVTDPSGAVVPGATIVIASPETGYSRTLKSDSAGYYSQGPLIPGSYTITVTADGFAATKETSTVAVGTATNGSVKLTVGNSSVVVEVNTGIVQVNTDQVGVAGLVTKEQIDTLPVNGRNILDIAQIQPGVQLQSGQTFDPTKTDYSALAVNGNNGRSTRVLIDGQDVSDETVGTVLFNIPEGAVNEFQLNRSTQDVSGSVTSTGQVLIATQSGTNRFHGNAFYNFQDYRAGFANVNGLAAPFQRNQFGGYVGGPIIKDKLFFFGGSERLKQANSSPVGNSNFFQTIYKQYPQVPDPFKDTFSIARLDYNAPHGIHLFARATYSVNAGFGTSGQNPYALFINQDNIPALVGGGDFTTGKFTHSLRFGYIKFINALSNGVPALGNTIYNPSTQLGVVTELIGGIYAGGNEDAPQKTFQSSKSFRYDGTWTKGSHSIKFGGEATRILQGGFAAFYSTFLTDVSTNAVHQLANCGVATGAIGPYTGTQCLDDPLNGYKPAEYVFGNGNGAGSERPGFGLPGGADFSWRMAAYVGDTWKVKPWLTVVAGLRWSVDTDRADQDLPAVTCGQVDPSLQFAGCDASHASTPLFDFYGPGMGLGKPTQQNWANFGPQAGFVFSPGSHRLAVRGGGGIFFENNLFNNQGNARAQNTPAQFAAFADGSNTYTSTSLNLPGYMNGIHGVTSAGVPCNVGNTTTDPGCISWTSIYGMSVAQATPIMGKLDALYKAAAASAKNNPSFIGSATGDGLGAFSAYAGPYKTPYAIQLNGGLQYQLKPGLIISADYVHNATLKVPLSIDTNHVGAARFLNVPSAQAAIAATTDSFGCTGGFSAAAINCAIAAGAEIGDFAGNGLDSGKVYLGSESASANGFTTTTGAAFPGANPNVGAGTFILPVGKSGYDAAQIVVQQQKSHPLPGIVQSNMQISYNLSRAVSNSKGGSNEFFAGSGAYDQDCVNCYIGRNDLDHSNELSLATAFTVKYGPQIGIVGHFFSAPPSTLNLSSVPGDGQIFTTDVDGDGQTGDLLPGTDIGYYMHQVKGAGLAKTIANYNATNAGKITPAGQALITAGLFTQAQLTQIGAVQQALLAAPTKPLENAATRTLDASIKYPIGYLSRFREGLVLTPGITMYNVLNMSNFGTFTTNNLTAASAAAGAAGTLNGPNTSVIHDTQRSLRGSGNGTFDQGGPRTTEFSLKLTF